MWGFLRVENEHLRIYGDSISSGSDPDQAGESFQQIPSATTMSSSTASLASLAGSINGGAGVPMMGGGRGLSGLDKLPYSRMEMPTTGLLRRATNPIKAWCLTKVTRRDFFFIILFSPREASCSLGTRYQGEPCTRPLFSVGRSEGGGIRAVRRKSLNEIISV